MKHVYRIGLCLLVILSLAGCQQPSVGGNPEEASSSSTALSSREPSVAETQVAAADSSNILQQVQAAVDRITTLQVTQNMGLIDSIVDPNLPHLAATMRTRTEQRAANGAEAATFRVDSVDVRRPTLVLAKITSPPSGSISTWPFRLIDGSWRITEPTEEELGEKVTVVTPHMTIVADNWSSDLLPDLEQIVELAMQDVQMVLPDVNVPPITMTVTASGTRLNEVHAYAIGRYEQGRNKQPDAITILSPHSYTAGFLTANGWKPEYTKLIAHEYTHYITTRQFGVDMSRIPVWMFEGIAEYVSERENDVYMQDIVANNEIVPIISETGRELALDSWSWESNPLDGYTISNAAVHYCIETYGGVEAFWKFTQVYQRTRSYTTSLEQVYQVSVKDFNQRWLAWVAANYG